MAEQRRSEYLFRVLSNQRLLYVSQEKQEFDPDTFRLFLGKPKELEAVKVLKVVRYPKDGVTVIATEFGILTVPPATIREVTPTWRQNKRIHFLKRLDPDMFEVVEGKKRASVTRKKKK